MTLVSGDHNSPGHRLYSHSEAMKKKQDKLREQREQEEERRLKRVPVAPPQHFDAVKYQQKLLERARKIDTARKRQEDKAQQLAQGHAFCLLLCKSVTHVAELTFQPTLNTSYQMKKDRVRHSILKNISSVIDPLFQPSVTMNAIDRFALLRPLLLLCGCNIYIPFRYKEIESSRRVRLAELLQQQEEDLQRDCTFKPQINQHPSHEQRGDFLAEAQLRERRKRLEQILATDNDAKDDAVVRTLRSAVSAASSPAVSNTGHRSPASSVHFSPALSRAASIVGVGGVEGGKASVAAHGRHEDPDLRDGFEVNAAAAVGAVEKVLHSLFDDDYTLAASLIFFDEQILVAPPAELPESDDDFQNGSDNDNHDHHDGQRYRRGGVRGSTVVAAAAASDEHSAVRLNARLQHENQANQAVPSSRSIRTPKLFNPRPSLVVARGNPAPVTPSLKQQLKYHSAPRPASAPARGREARDEAPNESSVVTSGATVRSRALPSRISSATAVATAASMQAAEILAANDQKLERQRVPSSLQHILSTPSHSSSNGNQNLPSMLYKDAEFRTLRRQLLGVQQELIMEQSATPYDNIVSDSRPSRLDTHCRYVSEKSEELARKSRLDSLERFYAKFCGGTSEMMTRQQFADAFKRTVYMKGVDASLGRLKPDEELVIAGRIWAILAGESTAAIDFETFGRFILDAPAFSGVQVRKIVAS